MSNRIRVVDRVADILGCFTPDCPQLGVSEISAQLDLDKATVCRILLTLKARDLVCSDPKTQKYSIGPQILRLALVARGSVNLRNQGYVYCLWLRDQTGETAALSIREGFWRLCVEQVESRQEIRRGTELGKPLPLYCGASGKMLLAHMPDDELEQFLAQTELVRLTENTIVDPEVLRGQLQQIREQEYTVSMGERVVGSVTIAAPVRDHRGQVVAALSVAMPSMRWQADKLSEYVAALQMASKRFSADLGYLPPSRDSH